jgi:polyhydroxyalkanoate synthesis regulator phasin
MQDAWRAYLELAFGLSEASRRKAQQVVRDLVGRGEATAAQVQAAASELLETSRANRETMVRLVRYEVDRALGAVGLASTEEVASLTARVDELERQLRKASGTPSPAAPTGPAAKKAAKKATAKKTAKKSTKKAPSKKAPSKKAPSKKAPSKKAAAKKTTARKAA